jgi:hypothetical protein
MDTTLSTEPAGEPPRFSVFACLSSFATSSAMRFAFRSS